MRFVCLTLGFAIGIGRDGSVVRSGLHIRQLYWARRLRLRVVWVMRCESGVTGVRETHIAADILLYICALGP